MKILMTILALTGLITSANANVDDDLKKQCQYVVNGNGDSNMFSQGILVGITGGMQYVVQSTEKTELGKTATQDTIILKACQNTFKKDILVYGFEKGFMWQVMRLISKQYAAYN